MQGKDQSKNIKNFLKPRANGPVKQGYFRPQNPEKYMGDPNNIIYRSSWEYKFLKWLDISPSVTKYSSEPMGIPYYNPLDKRGHTYYVDFYVRLITDSGKEENWIIEIKPNKYVSPPTKPKRFTDKQAANYAYAAKQFVVNQAKFEAARDYAHQKGIKFGIITENFLFKSL
jgi:hypothetical protein